MSRRDRDDDEGIEDNEWMGDDEYQEQDDQVQDDEESELWDDEDAAPTMACPYCGAEIHDDSELCPFCENYISREDAPASAKPLWIVLGVVLCLLLVLLWIFQ